MAADRAGGVGGGVELKVLRAAGRRGLVAVLWIWIVGHDGVEGGYAQEERDSS